MKVSFGGVGFAPKEFVSHAFQGNPGQGGFGGQRVKEEGEKLVKARV